MSKIARRYIKDKSGITYALDQSVDKHLISWELKYQNILAGFIKATKKSKQTLVIEDLKVFDYSEPPSPKASFIERLMEPSDPNGINFRRRRLSKKLLALFIMYAEEHGFQRIYGSVVRDDYDANLQRGLDLIKMYEKQGFAEVPSYPGCLKGAKAYICLILESTEAQESKLT